MKRLFFLLVIVLMLGLVSASITKINFPRDNDILVYSNNVELNVTSSASTNCFLHYTTSTGSVPYNQSINCNGLSRINLPGADGVYNITVEDDAGSSKTNTITIKKPAGILITLIYSVSFLILLSMLFVFIINLAKFAMFDTTVYNVAMSWTVYFGLLIILQLNYEYSQVPFILNWLELLQTIGGYVMFVFPLIAFVVTFIKKGFDKKQPLNPQEITGGKLLRYG